MPKPGDDLVSGRVIMQYWNTPFSVVAAMFQGPTRLTRPVSASAAAGTRRETHKDRRAATRIGSACLLELGPELRPAIDLDALDAEGDLGDELVEEGCGAA